MPKTVPHELAALGDELFIDTTDPDESIDELIDRIRTEIEEERDEAEAHFLDRLDTLDRIERALLNAEDDEPETTNDTTRSYAMIAAPDPFDMIEYLREQRDYGWAELAAVGFWREGNPDQKLTAAQLRRWYEREASRRLTEQT